MAHLSPLRYPGGKSSILDMVSKIISESGLSNGHYAEPYAGGCGLALSLLFDKHVQEIHLNDLDRSIWAFWHSILNETDKFIEKIRDTEITIDEWYKQRDIQTQKKQISSFELGFSSFFLNRTNRSGIIQKAGVIGGFKQEGEYKLDCRFHKENLIKRIQKVADHKNQIHLYNLDAIDFLQLTNTQLPNNSFYCIDPPYYDKGSTLYTNFYGHSDHQDLANVLLDFKRPWILTYDSTVEIQTMYKECSQFSFNLNYSAQEKRLGTELLVINKAIKLPETLNIIPLN